MAGTNLIMHSHQSSDLFASLAMSDLAKIDLERRMKEPWRHYHTLHHLNLLWTRHQRYCEVENLGDDKLIQLISFAIAYHDVVYVGGGPDNEARSARLWLDVSATATELSDIDRYWVAETIHATANHLGAALNYDGIDARAHARRWVIDLDLTPLGEDPDVFDLNMELLAAEIPHLSPKQKQDHLVAGLAHFASAQPLYRCPSIAAIFEKPARLNFNRYVLSEGMVVNRPRLRPA